MALRQPIVSVMGHVDHGKTTLLDYISGSRKAQREAGGITQQIHAVEISLKSIERICQGTVRPGQFSVPGLLFIDTPGHRAFISMRRRGGSLADIAVLVVAMNEGFMPQTREVLQILRHEKTPFIVVVNKLDLLPGFRPMPKNQPLFRGLETLPDQTRKALDERIYAIAEDLYKGGFSADRYDRVTDYSRNVALIPISAKTGTGIPDLMALIVGLAQKFLSSDLAEKETEGEATILERSEERGLGAVASVVLYNGRLRTGDVVAVSGMEKPFSSRIRALYKQAKITSDNIVTVRDAKAAAPLFISAPDMDKALPGGIVKVIPDGTSVEKALADLTFDSNPAKSVVENGVWLKTDTLGSLDALLFECQEAKIPVKGLEVGAVSKREVTIVGALRDRSMRAILAFNTTVLDEAAEAARNSGVKIISDEVIFRLIEQYKAWSQETRSDVRNEMRKEIPHPAKLQLLPGHVFRSSKPAIVGVKVLAGTVRAPCRLINGSGKDIGLLRGLQESNRSIPEAGEGVEVAAAIEGAVVGRSLNEGDTLYVSLREGDVRELKGLELSPSEARVLNEVVAIQRDKTGNRFWGL